MQIIVLTTMSNGMPDLPPMQSEDGIVQLQYVEGGVLRGGFSLVCEAPRSTILVQVDTSPATVAAMQAQPDRWPWIEEVP